MVFGESSDQAHCLHATLTILLARDYPATAFEYMAVSDVGSVEFRYAGPESCNAQSTPGASFWNESSVEQISTP